MISILLGFAVAAELNCTEVISIPVGNLTIEPGHTYCINAVSQTGYAVFGKNIQFDGICKGLAHTSEDKDIEITPEIGIGAHCGIRSGTIRFSSTENQTVFMSTFTPSVEADLVIAKSIVKGYISTMKKGSKKLDGKASLDGLKVTNTQKALTVINPTGFNATIKTGDSNATILVYGNAYKVFPKQTFEMQANPYLQGVAEIGGEVTIDYTANEQDPRIKEMEIEVSIKPGVVKEGSPSSNSKLLIICCVVAVVVVIIVVIIIVVCCIRNKRKKFAESSSYNVPLN